MLKARIAMIISCAALAAGALAQTAEISPEIVREVQVSLAARGFGPGPADGQLNAKTNEALRGFQRTNGLVQTGRIDAATLAVLGINSGVTASTTLATTALVPLNGTLPATSTLAGTPALPGLAPSAGMPGTGVPGTLPPGTNFLGGTPAGAPSPSFGATPAGAASTAFAPTPAGMATPAFGAPAPGASVSIGAAPPQPVA